MSNSGQVNLFLTMASISPSGEIVNHSYSSSSSTDDVVVIKSLQHQTQHPSSNSLGPTVTDAESLCSMSLDNHSERSHNPCMDYLPVSHEGEEEDMPGIAESPSSSPTDSILKYRSTDPSSIKDTSRAWKCLPQPDLESIVVSNQGSSSCSSSLPSSSGLKVSWGIVQIRSYSQTVGDNPSVSYGPPISLDWEYEAHEDMPLDDYELNRGKRRTLRQMVLSYYHRKNILSWQYGFTESQLKQAKKQAERAKLKRSLTRSLLPVMHAEAAVESVKRKAKRLLSKAKQ
eukprot:scaffold22585_cov149-Cylindrotheca_fusiformis.AAC.8